MLFNKLLLTLTIFQIVKGDYYTTTLNEQEKRAMAVEQDLGMIEVMLSDIDVNYASYTSYMAANNMDFPQELVQFVVDYDQVGDNTAEIVSFLISSLPLTQCYTFYSALPWYTSLLSEAAATTFYLPDDFSTVVLDQSATLDLSSLDLNDESGTTSTATTSNSNLQSTTKPASSSSVTLISSTEVSSEAASSSTKQSETSSNSSSTANGAIAFTIPSMLITFFIGLLL